VLRRRLCHALLRRCLARGRALSDAELRRAAVVFAPHPDDEVLGCGGTILRMRQLGTDVDVVFLTDGRHSHRGPLDRDALARIRTAEARTAATLLHLEPTRLHFLGFEDLHLESDVDGARGRVAAWLAAREPEQVFLPFAHDGHPDHRAANQIVRAALRQLGQSPALLEYSVHLWWRWPWCGRAPEGARYGVSAALRGLLASLRAAGSFARFVRIDAVVAAKRAALAAHASQVSDVLPGGPNLHTWSDGEFLAWACGDYEFFRPAAE
jgi:LmbE family N-acetylglucosaminyl deacetylase